jgi:hypothetical protein
MSSSLIRETQEYKTPTSNKAISIKKKKTTIGEKKSLRLELVVLNLNEKIGDLLL